MCEWLSCQEWCDVQLQCGGRTFSAHRAVLASVSTFLRQILLSCPIDETPTFIVLPDFDLEAMSSVLYYIYNGKVIIQKQKLETFVDIIKAMQIFIDSQYLPKLYNGVDNPNLNSSMYQENVQSTANKVFFLKDETCNDQRYVNLKKDKLITNLSRNYYSNNDSYFHDKPVSYCQDLRNQQLLSSRTLQSPSYGDRQRNSCLRDIDIETYPQNGNANGRAASVLAISNERYQGPTSMLLTNANGKNPKVDEKMIEHTSQVTRTFSPWKQVQCDVSYSEHFANKNTNITSLFTNCDIFGGDWLHPRMPYFPSQQMMPNLDQSISEYGSSKTSHITSSKDRCLVTNTENDSHFENCKKEVNSSLKSSNQPKGAILNQVLDSPWCPRVPNSYKPFRRKVQKSLKENNSLPVTTQTHDTKGDSDSNNNVQMTTLSPNLITRTITDLMSPIKELSDNCSAPSLADVTDDYKCTICDQVFATSDSLTSHMRRHLATARYSCGECSKSFSQLRNFKYHMSVHRGTREFAATCTVCGKYFNDRGYLSSHMKIHRNRKEYKCALCPKSFNQRVAYNMHVRIHTGVKPHICGECGKAFSRKMLLKQHLRTHSGERPYACAHCDKRFADRSNMTLHLRLHTGVKPFSCSLCPKAFTKKHHLKSHLNFHTGAKPYACPRCRLAFTQSSNMRTHLKKCNAPETESTDN